MKTMKAILPASLRFAVASVAVALTLATAACDGPVGPQGDPGPQGEQGDRGPRGPRGNGNVTLYVYDAHDFSAEPVWIDCIDVTDKTEWEESQWSAFLKGPPSGDEIYVPVPTDFGGGYDFLTAWDVVNPNPPPVLNCEDQAVGRIHTMGGGMLADAIHIFQIRANNVAEGGLTADLHATPKSVFPADLDLTDYNAIVEYYGLTEDDIVRM